MLRFAVIVTTLWPILSPGILAQLTIRITSVPASTPPGSAIFAAGTFNGWNPGDPDYVLTPEENDHYSITFSPAPGTIQFKFTRGSWETVEGTSTGGFLPNRVYTYPGGADTLDLTIAGWEDLDGNPHTATDNVQVLDEDYFIPQLNRTRRIWIYLPPDYTTSTKRYPVLYLQDGQNLFDAFTSFAGEWQMDESMNALFDQGDYGAIVVGIDHGEASRFDEYCPWIHPTYGGGEGEAYAAFLVETLKPHIDSLFRTLPGRAYTAVAGSSMGAVISMYAIAEYPDVFSKAGIFSPAFWVADSAYLHVASKTFSEQIRVYFVAGQQESPDMIPDMTQMYDLLLQEGILPDNLRLVNEADGEHAEWFWAREYPDAYQWLFRDLTLQASTPAQKKIEISPNPVSGSLTLMGFPPGAPYSLFSADGIPVRSGTLEGSTLETHLLPGGLYILRMDQAPDTTYFGRFIKP